MKNIHCLSNAVFAANSRPTYPINISAGGCAFHSPEAIAEGSRLKMKLVFRPSYQGIICSGIVVFQRHLPANDAENPYRISFEFKDINENDRQIIQRHIMQRDSASLSPNTL